MNTGFQEYAPCGTYEIPREYRSLKVPVFTEHPGLPHTALPKLLAERGYVVRGYINKGPMSTVLTATSSHYPDGVVMKVRELAPTSFSRKIREEAKGFSLEFSEESREKMESLRVAEYGIDRAYARIAEVESVVLKRLRGVPHAVQLVGEGLTQDFILRKYPDPRRDEKIEVVRYLHFQIFEPVPGAHTLYERQEDIKETVKNSGTKTSRQPTTHLPRTARCAMSVGSVLEALHGYGMLYHDIKFSNILESPGDFTLIDFDACKVAGKIPSKYNLDYLSPEVAYGLNPDLFNFSAVCKDDLSNPTGSPAGSFGTSITAGSDVFSLASLLWEMLHLEPLFDYGEILSLKELREAAVVERAFHCIDPNWDRICPPSVPTGVNAILKAALDPKPANRPSVRELMKGFEEYCP